ncbi:MAG: GerAB/ArcD/ProY family transporter [Bacillota bacterium]|nr:GerAB/ArcD/ProY family transporter [Bacillota bacterium]
MRNDRFTREQIIFLTFASGCSNMAFNFIWAVYLAGRSGWVALGIGILLIIPFIIAILFLSKCYPERNILDIINISFGKPLYIIIIIINAIINIVLGVTILNFLAGTVKVYFLQLTPSWVIILLSVIIALLFVNNKILLFGRTVELLTIWYIINYFAGFSLSFVKEFKVENIYPIFDTTLLRFGEAVFFSLGSASEILLFIVVMVEHMPQTKGSKRSIIKGIGLWSFVLSLAVFIMQGVSGTELLFRVSSAGVEISRVIYFGEFLRGLEVFILATYQLICILRLSLYLYCIWIPIKKVFNEKNSLYILVLISSIMTIFSIGLNSFNEAFFISLFMNYYVILPFIVIVIIIAFLGVLVMKKRNGSGVE